MIELYSKCNENMKGRRMRKWLLGHRKLVTICIIVISILLMISSSLLFFKFQKEQNVYVELLYYITQIISSIFVISGVVIAIWQYYLSCMDSNRNIDVICVQKAIDLSEYYKDNILAYIAAMEYIFDNSGISEIFSKIDKSNIEHFDQKELFIYIKDEDRKKLKKIQNTVKFSEVIANANAIYNLGLNDELIKLCRKAGCTKFEQTQISTFLGKLITKILNNMEYFSMHFTHNVADETVVYKSLHQTYIKIVKMLYYHIAIKNPLSTTTKYFTNIIELYKIWNDRAINDEEKFAKDIRVLTNKGTVVENK